MNFLGHLWIAARTGTSMPGAILGDMVRGNAYLEYPDDVALGIRLHRRMDAVTDQHPLILESANAFPGPHRRYAPVLLDMVLDHCLARQWPAFHEMPLTGFCAWAGRELQDGGHWFVQAGATPPRADRFAALLLGYSEAAGMQGAIERTSMRLRKPEPMLEAAGHWPRAAEVLSPHAGTILNDLLAAADAALREWQAAPAQD